MSWLRKLMHWTPAGLVAWLVVCGSGGICSATEKIYQGMTASQLVAFAENEGWSAQTMGQGTAVEIRAEDFSASIQLLECNETLQCSAGVIRTISYQFAKPDRYGFWHWNLESHGATGFGPSYITLQRYIHLRGVSDLYLRDVIGRVWRDASQSFWREVERRVQPR